MRYNDKITIKNIEEQKLNFQRELLIQKKQLKMNFETTFYNIVKYELLKEDNDLIQNVKDCKECQYFTICNYDKKQNCAQLETLWMDYSLFNELNGVQDITWINKEKTQKKIYFALENVHLNRIINFLYDRQLATFEQIVMNEKIFTKKNPEEMLKKIRIEKNRIRERLKIRVIRKVIEIKEKYNKKDFLSDEQQEELFYQIFMEQQEGEKNE